MDVKNIPTLFLTVNEQNALRHEHNRSASPCLLVNCPDIDCDDCPLHKVSETYNTYKHELEVVLKNSITETDED